MLFFVLLYKVIALKTRKSIEDYYILRVVKNKIFVNYFFLHAFVQVRDILLRGFSEFTLSVSSCISCNA